MPAAPLQRPPPRLALLDDSSGRCAVCGVHGAALEWGVEEDYGQWNIDKCGLGGHFAGSIPSRGGKVGMVTGGGGGVVVDAAHVSLFDIEECKKIEPVMTASLVLDAVKATMRPGCCVIKEFGALWLDHRSHVLTGGSLVSQVINLCATDTRQN